MDLVRDLHNIQPRHRGCVATIGNFDGVHRGHQALIRQLRDQAASSGLPAAVITFEPHPIEFFLPQSAAPRLTCFREKFQALARQSIDRMVCLKFGESLARQSGREFVENLLVDRLGARYVVVGDDFRFGRNREGDIQLLAELASRHGYEVVRSRTFTLGGMRVSSSRIREALSAGDLEAANAMLGRPLSISGRVVHGDRRGRELGFPTANIDLRRRRAPLRGIFAVRVYGCGRTAIDGVASVGTRPMFGTGDWLLEAHLFDFGETIYGVRIEVEFLKWIRDEQRFANVAGLRAQMQKDVREARAFFSRERGSRVATQVKEGNEQL